MPNNLEPCRLCRAVNCTCAMCSYCYGWSYSEDICSSCGKCTTNGCCDCVKCQSPGCDQLHRIGECREHNRICNRCLMCNSHCKCFVCTICNTQMSQYSEQWCAACNTCISHCTHYSCTYLGCGLKGNKSSLCRLCSRCDAHCACVTCPSCLNIYRQNSLSLHNECGRCLNCCTCNITGVKFRKGNFKFHTSAFNRKEFKINKLRNHISVEIEVDKINSSVSSKKVNDSLDLWKDPVVRDGSLGMGGFEITTNPTNGDLFLNHIKDITDGLAEIKAACSSSCGLHVHVNCKGEPRLDAKGEHVFVIDAKTGGKVYQFDSNTAYNQYDLHRLVLLYDKVEQAMFGLCSSSRLTGRYSKICGKYWLSKSGNNKELRKNLLTTMYFSKNPTLLGDAGKKAVEKYYGTKTNSKGVKKINFAGLGRDIKSSKSSKYNDVRYNALNVHSYFLRGTVEFRHHEGSVDYNEIVNWSLICAAVVNKAQYMTEEAIKNLPSDSYEALLAILPEPLQSFCTQKWDYFNTNSWNRLKMVMNDKFELAQ